MFRAWMAAISMGLLWVGLSAPASAGVPSCTEASKIFETARDGYARTAPPPSDAPDAETAQEQARGLDKSIAAKRAALDTALAESGAKSMATVTARIELAGDLRRASRFKAALEELAAAEVILAKLEPKGFAMAGLLRSRGIILSNLRKREAAIIELQQANALHVSGPAQDAALEALNSHTLGQVLRGLSRFDEALKALKRASTIYDRDPQGNARQLAEVLIDTFTILTRLDDWAGARAVIGRAVTLSTGSLGAFHPTTARALHNQAIVLRKAEDYQASFTSLGQALAIYHMLGNGKREAEALDEAARSMGKLVCYQDALRFDSAALNLFEKNYGPYHVSVAEVRARLGTYARDSGDLARAAAYFKNAISIFDELLGPDNVRSAGVQRELASVQSRAGNSDAAVDTLLRSIRSLEQENAPDELRESLRSLSSVLAAQGNINAAILFAKKAVNEQQEIRAANRELPPELATSLAQRYRDVYLWLADLLIEQGRLEEAQRVVDLIKSQEIIDFVRGGRPQLLPIDGRAPLTRTEGKTLSAIEKLLGEPFAAATELEKLTSIAKTRKLDSAEAARAAELKAALKENYRSFQTEAKALIDALATESAAVQGEIVQLHLDMLGQTQKKLRPFKGRAVVMQVASLADAVHIFITGPTTQVHRKVEVPRSLLARMAFDGWNATARARPDAQAKLKALYDVLVRPVEADLKASGATVVMLNLEGFLRYVPFASLYSGDHYFVEDYAIAMQTPAADTQYAAAERDRTRAAGFGVTDALHDFVGLPGVANELEALFDGADNAGVFAGSPHMNRDFSADEFAAVLEEHPQYVHIASHFKLEPGDDSKSFLLLGTGDALSLEAIRTDARFQFTDVDLLTLSACETAGEVGSDGKEVESFATLAQASGASSVMATLWPIADESTATLMADFYRGLLDGGLDKATALQQAQVAMIHGGAMAQRTASRGASGVDEPGNDAEPLPRSHPYYWSAFILLGNWL